VVVVEGEHGAVVVGGAVDLQLAAGVPVVQVRAFQLKDNFNDENGFLWQDIKTMTTIMRKGRKRDGNEEEQERRKGEEGRVVHTDRWCVLETQRKREKNI